MFSLGCIYCGARLIQRIATLPIPDSDVTRRRRAMLADWVKAGHPEAQLRSLAKGESAIQPPPAEPGPAPSSASVRHSPKKRR